MTFCPLATVMGAVARTWQRRRGVQAQTVLAAALTAAVVLAVGAVWVQHVVATNARAATENLARSEVDLLLNLINAGSTFDGDFGPLPYEVVAGDGVLIASSSQLKPLESAGPVMPAPRQGGSEPLYRVWNMTLDSTDPGLTGKVTALDGTIPVPASVGRGGPYAQVSAEDRVRVYVFVTSTQTTAALAIVRPYLLIAVPLGVVLIGLVAAVAVRRSLRPVEAIRRRTAEVSAADPRERVAVPRTGDEVQALAETINATLQRLDRSAADQRRFVADAAHELRSPLTTMITTLDVARAYPADAEAGYDVLLRSAERMQSVIEDLLILARLDAGLRPEPQRVDLDDVARRAVAATVTSVPIDLQSRPGLHVWGDSDQLERILRNLVDNAVRHAEHQVLLQLRRAGDRVEAVVADDGVGVPADQRERVFDRFTRLDDARSRDRGGSGLGLAIARDLAAAHGGTLTATSRSDGDVTGGRFQLELPASPPALEP